MRTTGKNIGLTGHARLPLLLLCLTLLFLLGAIARAGAAEAKRQLRLGLEPEHNIFTQIENYRKLTAFLSESLELDVKLTIMSRYGEVLKRFKTLELDGAFLNSYTAALAVRELELEPVARLVDLRGEAVIHGYILARRDSKIRTVGDMRGRHFAFVDQASTSGYLFPLAYFRRNGVTEISTFFAHLSFTGSHTSTISAILDGRAEIGAAKDTIFNQQVARDPAIGRELTILAKSPPLPAITLCLRPSLPEGLSEQVTEILLAMETSPGGRQLLKNIDAVRFTRAARSDYQAIHGLEIEAGLAELGH